ncbi:hypothetical protein CVT26_006627 [Gymnopilus dilepis]|uniref:Uncharacterized protein n=1 Tax=Gymnopilus dilepis TaxID=231916 RepID=A0A409Y341_9AGAR|nr:hypothetical protein CVT26_006627 [Gymnopilus dilepis]
MDERESWRPRIFYSSGPQQGLLEPFPPPTHIRRKERSSYNRGTLYPSNTHSAGILHNNFANRRYHESHGFRQHHANYVDNSASHMISK